MPEAKHCPTCTCTAATTLPILGDVPVQTGIMVLTANAEGYEAKVYDMPPAGTTPVNDIHLRGAGQYDHEGRLIREL